MEEHEEKCTVVLKGGTDIADSKLVFSVDSKFIAGCSGSEVKVWSLASGQCVQRLKGHKGRITAIALHPANPYQLYSTCQSGFIKKWDFMDGVELASWKTSSPCLAILPTKQSTLYALTGIVSKPSSALVSVELSGNESSITKIHHGILPKDNAVAISCQELFVAAVTPGTLVIHTLQSKNETPHVVQLKHQVKNISKSGEFCCVSTHPKEMCIATGMKDGKIILWWFCVTERKITAIKPMHWHSLRVNDISFTALGTNFLSGGHECVLVRWQHNSSERSYLPRLGSPITRITTSNDNTLYALCHADNSIQIISQDFKVIQVMQGLTLVQGLDHTGLILDPKSGSIVMNGRPGHLQFYNLETDTQLFNLDIVCQNYISPENLRRPLIYTEVSRSAFSPDGEWLATVEERIDRKTTPEIRLKFWKFNTSKQQFVLNTSVASPHELSVTDFTMRPALDLQAVSTSVDGRFKLWSLVDDTDIYRKRQRWSCESVGFYRDCTPSKATYSSDGSILAVAFDTSLTLWDPDTNQLCEALSHPSKITHLAAGVESTAHLLICGTSQNIYAWNLLSCSVHWCLDIKPQNIVVNPSTEVLAVFTQDLKLKVLHAETSDVVFEQDAISPGPVTSALFVLGKANTSGPLSWMGSSKLYYLDTNQELFTLEYQNDEDLESNPTKKLKQDLPETTLSQILKGKAHKSLVTNEEDFEATRVGTISSQFLSEMLSTPAHVLPAVTTLCLPFLSELMVRSKSHVKHDDEEDEEEEEEMEVDSDDGEMEVAMVTKSEVKPVVSRDQSSAYHELNPQMFHAFR
ncbi:hypothetical protein CAPTEDRAFT_208278 [Capitella teleta]|uniref:WD repeat-containing protein 75 second beta-propeller domain-containing protein n=1 Tax=Capitella teleta TaxID=283909 RepID=R7TX40_CAPTE|nr:hypothetical protein CAPTEDRAFT_208278 [Capitella teleta]|eukprot:ELT98172.1 hypothetical protein CAPTEDRAFT_208278 [Capitella teleta]